jgi:hypothetical protein
VAQVTPEQASSQHRDDTSESDIEVLPVIALGFVFKILLVPQA